MVTVDIRRVHRITYDWLRCARVDLYIGSSQCLEYCPCVECRLVESGITVNRADT
jgi:hypothetical protein